MSKSRIAMAAIAVAVIMQGALPQRSAQAGFRLRIGGPVGVARMAVGDLLGLTGLHRLRMASRHGRIRTAALQPQNLGAIAESARPSARAQLTAAAALASSHRCSGLIAHPRPRSLCRSVSVQWVQCRR